MRKSQTKPFLQMALRPVTATQMLVKHRRTLGYMLKRGWYSRLYNFAFVTYFIRGEDCGKGCLDPMWYLFPSLVPTFWDIEVEVTTRCYLKCIFCEHTFFPEEYQNQDLTFDKFKNIVDSIPRLKWINLTGEGSPYLNKEFPKMLEYVKEKNLYVDFSHDFVLFNETIAKQLVALGTERIYFSLDGATKETYEKIRVGSKFERVLDNVRLLIRLKKEMRSPIPEICFRYAFCKYNIGELEQFVELVHSLGDLGDDPSINFVGLLDFEGTKDLVCEVPQGVVEGVSKRAKMHGISIYWSHTTHIDKDKPPANFCVFWTEPYVMITGHIVPDCAVLMSNRRPFLEKVSFGNVNEIPLKDIWELPKYREFRKMLKNPKSPVPEVCLGCKVYATEERAKKYGIWKMGEG